MPDYEQVKNVEVSLNFNVKFCSNWFILSKDLDDLFKGINVNYKKNHKLSYTVFKYGVF